MKARKRLLNILYSLLLMLASVIMIRYPEEGYEYVIALLDITLIIYGFRMLIYYFSMARYMVGGIATLYKSIIVIDTGLFIFSLDSVPQKFAMLYLVAGLAFSGIVDLLRVMELKRMNSQWLLHTMYGASKLIISVACLFFLNSIKVVTILYAVGLIHSAIFSCINAFRRTAIVYVGT